LRVAIENLLLSRLETLSAGERLAMARQGPGAIAAALLKDADERVLQAALENPRMTEASIVKTLMADKVPEALVLALCRHPLWSLRQDVRMALLRNPLTPLAHLLAIVPSVPLPVLRDILHTAPLDASFRAYLSSMLEGTSRPPLKE
jgi:hypothetical protein